MSSYSDTLQQGATIGCYQIEEVLGRGGFAVTYLAIDQHLDVYVAIKEYLPREIITRDANGSVRARDSEFAEDYDVGLESFAREAKTLALFKHPNIVRVHQVLHENNTAYMVMDYEHGQELGEVLENRKSLSEEDLRAILLPVFDGIAEIHAHGYVHRDIKPSNIYLRDNGSPVLLDFGAARYTMSDATQQLTAVVTVGYTPIEQYNVSNVDQGPWTDIYALAAVIYEAVTGDMPVDSVTRASTGLTNAADPLVSVRDKSLHPCSNDFYNAVDWGLRMDAHERPQSISQWRAAFDGNFNAPAAPQKTDPVKPPARKSKLRSRATSLAATETESYRRNTQDFPVRDIDIEHYPDTRIEPSFGESLESIESVDIGDQADTGTKADSKLEPVDAQPNAIERHASRQSGTTTGANNESPVSVQNSNSQHATRQGHNSQQNQASRQHSERRGESPTAQQDGYNIGGTGVTGINRSGAAATTAIDHDGGSVNANNSGKTHTQEIRDVVRRDIMKRDVDNTPPPAPPGSGYEAAASTIAAGRTSLIRTRGSDTPVRPPEPVVAAAPIREEVEFDESDWDYERPSGPSRWKWILPATGLAAVFAASMLYVNRPGLFDFSKSNLPEMTIDAALGHAQDKVEGGQFVFPAGESALDYYNLVLGSDPTNAEALAGIALIETQVRDRIVAHVEDNSLSEANRLLSRANQAGLNVEDIPASGEAPQSATIPHHKVIAIDTDLSPFLQRQIAKIEEQIKNGESDAAQRLFDETDKYLPDTEISAVLQQKINESRGTSDSAAKANNTLASSATNQQQIASQPGSTGQLDNRFETSSESSFENIAAGAETITANAAEVPAIAAGPAQEDTRLPAAPDIAPRPSARQNNTDQGATLVASNTNSPANSAANSATNSKPAPVVVPRKSYIAGSGASARHLNQLRTAIEAKNINRILQVSDNLPKERVDFLKRMFRRYDRLDVVIDQVRNQSDRVSATLNVAMFNQRRDGSYYSAGRWDGVTLRADKSADEWQKIEW